MRLCPLVQEASPGADQTVKSGAALSQQQNRCRVFRSHLAQRWVNLESMLFLELPLIQATLQKLYKTNTFKKNEIK